MGRIFEKRKHRMFARYDKMSKAFTRIGKEIAIAVKQGGPDVNTNPRLRAAVQNGKAHNMPKERVEAAIKRASSKEEKAFEETVFEGYGPHGVAVLVETATENNTRTVANIRMHFSRGNGSLGKTGSLDFLFERKGIFQVAKPADISLEDLELDLIDFGAEEILQEEDGIYIYTNFSDFGKMQKALEERKIEVLKTAKERFPATTVSVTPEQKEEVIKLIEELEEDEDVQAVFHNMEE